MAKRMTTVEFSGTEEQEQELREVIAAYKDQEGALMPVLQKAQDIYGYLPMEVQRIIARGLNMSRENVYGVVSFYSHFTLNPKGVHNISVCMGTACYVKGAGEILTRIENKLGIKSGDVTPDRMFYLESARCIGACGLAPVMTIDDDVYGQISPADVDGIIDKYKDKGGQTE
jgi:NADP-reducing hydrogenase subunit HndA